MHRVVVDWSVRPIRVMQYLNVRSTELIIHNAALFDPEMEANTVHVEQVYAALSDGLHVCSGGKSYHRRICH